MPPANHSADLLHNLLCVEKLHIFLRFFVPIDEAYANGIDEEMGTKKRKKDAFLHANEVRQEV